MYHAASKQKKRAQLIFIYSLMVTAVLVLVSILVLLIQGYRFNRYDGKIEQGGLVQFSSRPDGATVTLDGIQLANKTASKLTVSAGRHTVTMTRDGYTSWKKDVVVQPGSVLWLTYARLYPSKLASVDVQGYPAMSSALMSPDRRQVVMAPASGEASLSIASLNDEKITPVTLRLPAAAYTAPVEGQSQSWTPLSWDKDSHLVLVKHTIDGGRVEYISVDVRDVSASYNISSRLGVELKRVEYALSGANSLYMVTTANELRRGDIGASSLSGPLLTNVADFSQYGSDTIVYMTLPGPDGQTAGYLTSGASKPRVITTMTAATTTPLLHLVIGDYYGDRYFVVVRGDETEISTGNLPTSDSTGALELTSVAKLTTPGGYGEVRFSPGNHRYVAVRQGMFYVMYDLELGISTTTNFSSATSRPFDWLDGDHVATTYGGTLIGYDYDASNAQTLAQATADLPVSISENGTYIYYFKSSPTGSTLARIKIIE